MLERSLKQNELIHCINHFFLKNLNVNLFIRLHLEANLSHGLNSGSESAFMTANFSVKHRLHFHFHHGWVCQALGNLTS